MSGQVLYGRQAVHEALRAGRRKVHRIWATAGAAREDWLDGMAVEIADGDWIAKRCGSDAHQGVCADAESYPTRAPASCCARRRR